MSNVLQFCEGRLGDCSFDPECEGSGLPNEMLGEIRDLAESDVLIVVETSDGEAIAPPGFRQGICAKIARYGHCAGRHTTS